MRHRKVGRILIRHMSFLLDTLILPWCAATVIAQAQYDSLAQRLTHTSEASGYLRDQMPSQRCELVMKDCKTHRVVESHPASARKKLRFFV